ncbi:MAG TPA: hypothetical protein VJK51_00070 [Candidatus Nanoarchaeia archaeon]|nr:hypothetical protein [Candidatus Nanoarchaeia archaeon]
MMRSLLRNNKGVSEIVNYALLIVIALALSFLVYKFLFVFVPKERITCDEDISLIITEATCTFSGISAGNVQLKVLNKGRFSIDSVFIRLGKSNQKVKSQINGNLEEIEITGCTNRNCLKPGDIITIPTPPTAFNSEKIITDRSKTPQEFEIEIQPAQWKKARIPCPAVITQPITCTKLP